MPQLITEAYLRRQVDLKMAALYAPVFAELFVGPVGKLVTSLRFFSPVAKTWDKDKTVQVPWMITWPNGGYQAHQPPMTFVFGEGNYDTGLGDVKVGACHRLPGAGVESTGEYQTFGNENGLVP